MHLRHSRSLMAGATHIDKVTAIAWSPNSRRLAVATLNRVVNLFDENGELKDRFATKPADSKASKLYVVTSMVFSHDSTKLAIGQSDDILFVYKLGLEWGEKKSICNKFQETSSVVSILWPSHRQQEIVYGLMEGKVKVGQLRTNRSSSVYAHGGGSSVVSLASSPDGFSCLAGHLDGSIYKFMLDNSTPGVSSMKIITHGTVPLVLAWGKSIVVAGPDCKVTFYDVNGVTVQQLKVEQEFCCGAFHPTGETVVLGHFGGFKLFSSTGAAWDLVLDNKVSKLYTVSALTWNPDGSQLVVGTLCGKADVFDLCMRRQRYLGKFELAYITKSQVLVTRLSSKLKMVVGSQSGNGITKFNIYNEQYIVAHTSGTILVGNLESGKFSEVPWCGNGSEKFLLQNPFVCMIYDVGELVIIEYGYNEVLGSCRTEHVHPFLVSVALGKLHEECKRIAYLVDIQTIRIVDLISGVTVGAVSHDCRMEWLQMNSSATYLLFRDAKCQLHLFNLLTQERTMLLSLCSFVQWVSASDVIVAQNQNNLYVWYTIRNPEQATMFPIKGEVTGIDRGQERTEVIVNEGFNTVSYVLDEALIDFGSSLESLDFGRAVSILESLELTPEIGAMWKQLAERAFENKELAFAERCYAALGDVSKARYFHKVNKLIENSATESGAGGTDNYLVKAKLALLQRQWKTVEDILLEHGCIAEAIQMYTECHRWKEAITIAKSQNHPGSDELQQHYFKWLLETCQDDEAGKLKEADGDILGAINLYLNGGLPACAADCVKRHPTYDFENDVLERIAEALSRANKFEDAGDFFERLGKFSMARDAYVKGHAYGCAVELARRHYPEEVPSLEEEWGDWLVSTQQVDAAVNHYIEAGHAEKAIDSAVASSQWLRAFQIVESPDVKVSDTYFAKLAEHFQTTKEFSEAEKMFIQAGIAKKAAEMYLHSGRWEDAHRVATKHLPEAEYVALCLQWAAKLQSAGYYKDAESLYLQAKQHDLAISMYRKAGLVDQMISLVAKYRGDLLNETHLHLAHELENDGLLRDAEAHYLEGRDWNSCVKMYIRRSMWEDAMRIAKTCGGVQGAKQVAYRWAISLGGESGAHLLARLGLTEQAVDYAMETGAFDNAFDLCRSAAKHKLPEVHLRCAMFFEDEGRFEEAEDQFIKAGRPREAIDMYLHQQDWQAAIRVADLCEPSAIVDIRVAQAEHCISNENFAKAESFFLKAKKPELAIEMYCKKENWEDAIRVARAHLPSAVADIQRSMTMLMQSSQNGGLETLESIIARAKALEHGSLYSEAIDVYLRVGRQHVVDFQQLQKVWDMALHLAETFEQNRLKEIVSTICKRMATMRKFDEAICLYERINSYKEAIDMCITFGLWDQARRVAAASDAQMQQRVENLFKEHLMKRGEARQLAEAGNVTEALELYMQQSNWQKVHELASLLGPESERECSFRHAKQFLQEEKLHEAVSILTQYGVPSNPEAYQFCCAITCRLLRGSEDNADTSAGIQKMRNILFHLLFTLSQASDSYQSVLAQIEKLFLVLNYLTLRSAAQTQGLLAIAAKLSVSLLRYIDVIPADKAFYEAGTFCKQIGWQNMAFVYLNHYLDIAECIDCQSGDSAFDSSALETTDIPVQFPIPPKHFLEESSRDQVRDWLIQLSMDQKVEPVLPTRTCERCSGAIYEASLSCFYCKLEDKACCVTGYPVLRDKQTCCKNCEMPANEDDWNAYLLKFQRCPWCDKVQP